jgi:hypothetical protein
VVDALLLQYLWTGRRPALPATLKRAYQQELAAFPDPPPAAPQADTPPATPTLF